MITKKTLFKLFSEFVFIFFLISSCSAKKLEQKNLTITTQDNKIFTVKSELAKTETERNYGFMNRKNIPDGTGMIFIFEKDQILSFWMKNTPHPLSIAYIDSKGNIKDIFDMTPFSLSPIVSTSSCRYALEVPQGWFKKNGIKIGDKLAIDFN